MEYKKLGKFQLESSVAKGGMGEILRSIDERGQVVALKKILLEHQNDETFRSLFIRESEITFQLHHPNIVKALYFDTIGRQLVLALEYLDGVTLRDILRLLYERKLQMPIGIAVEIMKRVLRGLAYAHQKRDDQNQPLGIVHRDLNPSNVFVTLKGEVKILDFGISKATQRDVHNLTPDGELRGKMCYLSPEQIATDHFDHRSDLFACGIVLWELLTSRPLFLRDEKNDVMADIVEGRYQTVVKFRPEVPPSLRHVLNQALATDPTKRFQNAEEFEEALDQVCWKEKNWLPGITEAEISIFTRMLFQKDFSTEDLSDMSGCAWLLTQMPGQEEKGRALARKILLEGSTRPDVLWNLARCELMGGDRTQGLRLMRQLARVETMEDQSQSVLEWLGVRRRPVVTFLKRSNPLNRVLGVVRHRILGPTPYQQQFLAA